MTGERVAVATSRPCLFAVALIQTIGLHDEEPLYWSNDDGWVSVVGATAFSRAEATTLNLPFNDGYRVRWVPAAWAYQRDLEALDEPFDTTGLLGVQSVAVTGMRKRDDDEYERDNANPEIFSVWVTTAAGEVLAGDFGCHGRAQGHAERLALDHGVELLDAVPADLRW
jgi:hypothetical protein